MEISNYTNDALELLKELIVKPDQKKTTITMVVKLQEEKKEAPLVTMIVQEILQEI